MAEQNQNVKNIIYKIALLEIRAYQTLKYMLGAGSTHLYILTHHIPDLGGSSLCKFDVRLSVFRHS